MLKKIESYSDKVNLSGYHHINDDGLFHGIQIRINNRNEKFQEIIYKNGLKHGLDQVWLQNKSRFDIITYKNSLFNGIQIQFIIF